MEEQYVYSVGYQWGVVTHERCTVYGEYGHEWPNNKTAYKPDLVAKKYHEVNNGSWSHGCGGYNVYLPNNLPRTIEKARIDCLKDYMELLKKEELKYRKAMSKALLLTTPNP